MFCLKEPEGLPTEKNSALRLEPNSKPNSINAPEKAPWPSTVPALRKPCVSSITSKTYVHELWNARAIIRSKHIT